MNCTFDQALSLDEWMLRVMAPLGNQRFPLGCTIELTERCNLRCIHCYINAPAKYALLSEQELSTNQIKGLLDQLADAGVFFLTLTGGEPLLRQDFGEIFIHARKKGMLISLFSNGTLLTDELADLLAAWNLNSLEISLYGGTQATYEKVTRQPGSFARCVQGIELALERGIKVSLKSVLLTVNQHELTQMQDLAAHYDLIYKYDSTIWPRLNGDDSPLQYQISDEDLLYHDFHDPERLEAWLEEAQRLEGRFIRSGNIFSCGAAFRSFHITASGHLTPCMMVRQPAYNLTETSFTDAWEQLGAIRNLPRVKNTECETCSVAALCTQCPGWSLAYYDDLETPVPHICQLGRQRAVQITPINV